MNNESIINKLLVLLRITLIIMMVFRIMIVMIIMLKENTNYLDDNYIVVNSHIKYLQMS